MICSKTSSSPEQVMVMREKSASDAGLTTRLSML